MVERPIKGSERQASPGDVVEEVLGTEPSAIEDTQDSINQSPKERITTPTPEDKQTEKQRQSAKSERSRQVRVLPWCVV